ncbi:hypothetical protein PHJA_000419100 [Phtheirospermum japonicum]|uniref:Uncharacterized protein n=1 Tax=Phtheirospermum japonicum TaxID=374723 RepID=A0A830B554_9LAMI|nr:hypothetical protein PHJA_000419100 [Phtheirospermum japonicum]
MEISTKRSCNMTRSDVGGTEETLDSPAQLEADDSTEKRSKTTGNTGRVLMNIRMRTNVRGLYNLVRKVKDFAYELFDEYMSLYAPLSSASGESFSRLSIIEDDGNSSCLWEMIRLVGVRNIMLWKKPQIENCDVGENSTVVAALSHKGEVGGLGFISLIL